MPIIKNETFLDVSMGIGFMMHHTEKLFISATFIYKHISAYIGSFVSSNPMIVNLYFGFFVFIFSFLTLDYINLYQIQSFSTSNLNYPYIYPYRTISSGYGVRTHI